jgi:hypothetical protein
MQAQLFEARGIPHLHTGAGLAKRSLPMKSGHECLPVPVASSQQMQHASAVLRSPGDSTLTHWRWLSEAQPPDEIGTRCACECRWLPANKYNMQVQFFEARGIPHSAGLAKCSQCLHLSLASSQQMQHASAAL